jgi:hypothetical protein
MGLDIRRMDASDMVWAICGPSRILICCGIDHTYRPSDSPEHEIENEPFETPPGHLQIRVIFPKICAAASHILIEIP